MLRTSSISSFRARLTVLVRGSGDPDDRAAWLDFVRTFLITFVAALVGLVGFIYLIDPYDSGRTPLSLPHGTTDKDSRYGDASYGRNPAFDAFVIGNSHGQILHPERLSALTGKSFVQMSVPGTTPREQTALLKYVVSHHPRQFLTIILVVDPYWCSHDPKLPIVNPFPFWLYDEDYVAYLAKLLTTQSFDRAIRRAGLMMGWLKVRQPRGFDDYEQGVTWNFRPAERDPTAKPAPFDAARLSTEFPGVDLFEALLKNELRSQTVIAVMPYFHVSALPIEGSFEDADLRNCKARFASAVASHSKARFVDLLVDGPVARDPRNFMDSTHYRRNVAELIEKRIADELAALPAR